MAHEHDFTAYGAPARGGGGTGRVELPDTPRANPCLGCGACCAFFRCSFYWREADDATPGGVPVDLTGDLTPHRRAMRGTNQATPRCVALGGVIGEDARCGIYARRPTTCRVFVPSWYDGVANDMCDRARAAHGLPPLEPHDWDGLRDEPETPEEPPTPSRPLRPAA